MGGGVLQIMLHTFPSSLWPWRALPRPGIPNPFRSGGGEYGHFLDNNTINYSNFNLQLINLVNDKELVNTEMLEQYFKETVYPTCIKAFQIKTVQNGPSGMEDEGPLIASLIMDAINCESLTRGKLC